MLETKTFVIPLSGRAMGEEINRGRRAKVEIRRTVGMTTKSGGAGDSFDSQSH
jgi:hypothetical protein